MTSIHYPLRARARAPIALLRPTRDMAVQCRIVEQLGAHGALTVQDLGRRIYPTRPLDELPLATLFLAVQDLRKDGLVRRSWISWKERYRLTRSGEAAHRYLVGCNWSDLLP